MSAAFALRRTALFLVVVRAPANSFSAYWHRTWGPVLLNLEPTG